MKKLLFLAVSTALLTSCNNTTSGAEEKTETAEVVTTPDYQYYGDSITEEGAVESKVLFAMMNGQDSVHTKVVGTVNESCKKKGCWMMMDLGDGKEMRVTFKDYGFFVPTDLNGETAVIDGYASVDTTSVDDLRHYAVDGGMTEEEAAAKYTQPEVSLTYVATGVIIK
jgi:hypothetical protein